MAITDPGKLLEQMGAKVGKRRILLHVIGVKMRDPETGRVVPMLQDAPPFVTWAVGVGFAEPSKEQQARCLAYWAREPRAPSSFAWIEGEQPKLKPEPKPKKSTPNKETDDDRT